MVFDNSLLKVRNLKTVFNTREGVACAVNDVSFDISKGEVVGLVGESGSGKSITALSFMKLISPPGKIVGGEILFKDQNLLALPDKEMRKIRGNRISMIFQDPMTSLNPLQTIGDQIAELFILHKGISKSESKEKVIDALNKVQIPAAEQRINEYPHQLSGGMRQRVMIAMALACEPDLLIADEPTTALDVTIQAQIMSLINDLKDEYGMSILLITHDLGLVAENCDRVAVMYAGEVVETGNVDEVYDNPRHPYTASLLAATPRIGQRMLHGQNRLYEIKGTVPSLYQLPKGCNFAERCNKSYDDCFSINPEITFTGEKSFNKCHLKGREAL